jgi:hypothetical protein
MKRLIVCLLALLATPLGAEVVHLTDGTSLEGDLRRVSDGWLVTSADGKTTVVTAAQVKSIELRKTGGSTDAADLGLGSLRRAVANQSDINRIIERYQGFIAHNPGAPAATEAEQDLAIWQDRLDKGLVKAGHSSTLENLTRLRLHSTKHWQLPRRTPVCSTFEA